MGSVTLGELRDVMCVCVEGSNRAAKRRVLGASVVSARAGEHLKVELHL